MVHFGQMCVKTFPAPPPETVAVDGMGNVFTRRIMRIVVAPSPGTRRKRPGAAFPVVAGLAPAAQGGAAGATLFPPGRAKGAA